MANSDQIAVAKRFIDEVRKTDIKEWDDEFSYKLAYILNQVNKYKDDLVNTPDGVPLVGSISYGLKSFKGEDNNIFVYYPQRRYPGNAAKQLEGSMTLIIAEKSLRYAKFCGISKWRPPVVGSENMMHKVYQTYSRGCARRVVLAEKPTSLVDEEENNVAEIMVNLSGRLTKKQKV